MRKIILVFIFLGSLFDVTAQSFVGFLTENYSGVNSVIVNPANIVDSRFKADVNLVGVSSFGGNDYYNFNVMKAINDDDYDFDTASRYSPKTNNSGAFNFDVMGPSFMFNINQNNAIAVYTRARSFANVNGINGRDLYAIEEDLSDDFTATENGFNTFGQAWAEIGLSYARVLVNEKENFLKGGISLKYLKGGGSAFVAGSNITVDYDEDGTMLPGGNTTGSVSSTGEVVYGRFDDFDRDNYDYELPKNATGFGVDIGIIYEWRPNHGDYKPRKVWPDRLNYKDQNKYKLKLGVSITDIGSVNYKNGLEDVFDITNTNVSEEAIRNEDNLYDILNNLYTLTNSAVGYKAILPTALHLNADWRFTNHFYLNLNADVSLVSKNKFHSSAITNMLSITPRFESKWFSFYTPLSLVQYAGFQVGAGLRIGPLYLGSGSLFTNLMSNKSKGGNFYLGFKVPILQKGIDKGSNCNCY
ncbi:hypothetical protein KO566_06840 [Flavobacteriaceae bacterium XHP0103]|uniref:DUF5723 family protein n=1 Tax=Marixanthotalea marina TaxID=2844359 RepID=UPI002989F678|nr:DUF5723 family protein [Marixanthotalea marina]MBU3821772.1 hypothetical protein [Marixanthotalea marina]